VRLDERAHLTKLEVSALSLWDPMALLSPAVTSLWMEGEQQPIGLANLLRSKEMTLHNLAKLKGG
jgi:hypothetical protein